MKTSSEKFQGKTVLAHFETTKTYKDDTAENTTGRRKGKQHTGVDASHLVHPRERERTKKLNW